MMEASEVHEEVKEKKKKIHFAVPSTAPTQLDPRQVEMIRRRRPTPATLFQVADQPCPEEDYSTGQWVVGENGVLRPKRLNPNVYQPPSLKAVQQMAEAHMQKLGVYPHMEEDGEDDERVVRCTADSQTETSSREETSDPSNTDRPEEEEGEEEEEEKGEEEEEEEEKGEEEETAEEEEEKGEEEETAEEEEEKGEEEETAEEEEEKGEEEDKDGGTDG